MQRSLPLSWARMCSWAGGHRPSRCCGVPVVHFDQSNPWKSPVSRYSTVTPSPSRRCSARFHWIRSAPFGPRELAKRILERFGGELAIEPRERIAQPLREDDLAVVAPLDAFFRAIVP